MGFQDRVKNRKMMKIFSTILSLFKFRGLNLNTSWKIILFWSIVVLVSLFFPWIDSIDNSIIENSFSKKSGWSWWIILLLVLVILFNLFSIASKEKLQLHIWVHFRDYPVSITLWFFIMIIWIISINFVNALQVFSSSIIHWSGVTLLVSGAIVITVWWIIQRVEFNKLSKEWRLYDDYKEVHEDIWTKNDKENNMKLPF